MSVDRIQLIPPYYAVIFSYRRSNKLEGYAEMDEKTLQLVQQQPGYLGYEVTGDGKEHAIFISYWKDLASIEAWRKNSTHQQAKQKGKTQWYDWYHSQICKVEHSSFNSLSHG